MFVYTQVCLSPGTVTSRRGIELNNKGKKWIKHDETKEAQRRRIQLKEERSTRQYQTKVREGDTYESDIGLWHSSDIQEIRPPVTTAQNQNLMTVISTAKIMFDVETTSLGNTCLYQFQSMFFLQLYKPFQSQEDHHQICPHNILTRFRSPISTVYSSDLVPSPLVARLLWHCINLFIV